MKPEQVRASPFLPKQEYSSKSLMKKKIGQNVSIFRPAPVKKDMLRNKACPKTNNTGITDACKYTYNVRLLPWLFLLAVRNPGPTPCRPRQKRFRTAAHSQGTPPDQDPWLLPSGAPCSPHYRTVTPPEFERSVWEYFAAVLGPIWVVETPETSDAGL